MAQNYVKLGLFLGTLQLVHGWSTFVVPHTAGQDDTPALVAALPQYATNSTILFEEGVTYNIFTPIKFPVLNNVNVRIEGNLTYPTDIPTIQGASQSRLVAQNDKRSNCHLANVSSNCGRLSMLTSLLFKVISPYAITAKSFPGSW